MSLMRSHRSAALLRTTVLAAGLAFGFAQVSLADPTSSTGDAPLKGPQVNDNRAPGAAGNFGASSENRKPGLDPRPDIRAFRDAMHETIGPDGTAALRATPEQHEKIETIVHAYMQTVRSYMEQHHDELETLRKQAGLGHGGGRGGKGGKGGKGASSDNSATAGAGTTTPSADTQAARQRLKEIMEQAPKPTEMINQVWQVLTPAQKTAVEARWEALKREHATDRGEKMFGAKARKQSAASDVSETTATPRAARRKVITPAPSTTDSPTPSGGQVPSVNPD